MADVMAKKKSFALTSWQRLLTLIRAPLNTWQKEIKVQPLIHSLEVRELATTCDFDISADDDDLTLSFCQDAVPLSRPFDSVGTN